MTKNIDDLLNDLKLNAINLILTFDDIQSINERQKLFNAEMSDKQAILDDQQSAISIEWQRLTDQRADIRLQF